MAAKPVTGPRLINGEGTPAAAARLPIVLDDLIDLILGRELATGTLMPWLTASLALRSLSVQQLLAFARASARRCCRPFGGSLDGGLELVRESRRACSSNRVIRSSNRAICASYPEVSSGESSTQASRPAAAQRLRRLTVPGPSWTALV